jgi:hypothetical protein
MEFSGRNQKGQRVMGMLDSGCLSTMVLADKNMMWNVPDHWTLEDAVTVPMSYGTVSCGEVNPKFRFYRYLAVLQKWEHLCPSILKSVCNYNVVTFTTERANTFFYTIPQNGHRVSSSVLFFLVQM